MDGRILRLQRLIGADLNHQWTVAELAREADVSTSHLHKLFKTATGESPLQYLKTLRLNAARQMLLASHLRIKDVCRKVGIPDQSNFIHAFRARYGIAPAAFRQHHFDSLDNQEAGIKKAYATTN